MLDAEFSSVVGAGCRRAIHKKECQFNVQRSTSTGFALKSRTMLNTPEQERTRMLPLNIPKPLPTLPSGRRQSSAEHIPAPTTSRNRDPLGFGIRIYLGPPSWKSLRNFEVILSSNFRIQTVELYKSILSLRSRAMSSLWLDIGQGK